MQKDLTKEQVDKALEEIRNTMSSSPPNQNILELTDLAAEQEEVAKEVAAAVELPKEDPIEIKTTTVNEDLASILDSIKPKKGKKDTDTPAQENKNFNLDFESLMRNTLERLLNEWVEGNLTPLVHSIVKEEMQKTQNKK